MIIIDVDMYLSMSSGWMPLLGKLISIIICSPTTFDGSMLAQPMI